MTGGAGRPTAVDLFSGAGGTTLGLRWAGFDVRVASDKDRVKAGWLHRNHPRVFTFGASRESGNVRLLDGRDIREAGHLERGPDLLVACPPCQGYSLQGRRRVRDSRNWLYRELIRLADELRPRAVSFENVPGMGTIGDGRYLADLVSELDRMKYETDVWDLSAANYGVPQARSRLFVVGVQGVRPKRPRKVLMKPTVTEAIADLPTTLLDPSRRRSKQVPYASEPLSAFAARLRGSRGTVDGCEVSRHTRELTARFHALAPGGIDSETRHRRLEPNGQATTLTAGTRSLTACRPVHPTQDRVLTVREAARLATFPDWYRFPWQIAEAWSQIGNSVPPRLAAAVFRGVRGSIEAS